MIRIRLAEGELSAPPAAIIGVIAEGGCAAEADSAADVIANHTLDGLDSIAKWKDVDGFWKARRGGASVLIVSFDEQVLEAYADEVWWVRDGVLVARGDPGEVLSKYRKYVAAALRDSGDGKIAEVLPSMRRGDGRATVEHIELIGANGRPATTWLSGEEATIAVSVRFAAEVADPVIGIMIRTRSGMNVYGTNTDLEGAKPGPMRAGSLVRIEYRFACTLCPGQYTVTVASHDPDGTWHDWLDDAVAFSVADGRYTAGVASLKASVRTLRN